MRLIDADVIQYYVLEKDLGYGWIASRGVWEKDIDALPTIEPPTTTWLGNYSPYTCQNCGKHTDSKTPYCAYCGRRARNYD